MLIQIACYFEMYMHTVNWKAIECGCLGTGQSVKRKEKSDTTIVHAAIFDDILCCFPSDGR